MFEPLGGVQLLPGLLDANLYKNKEKQTNNSITMCLRVVNFGKFCQKIEVTICMKYNPKKPGEQGFGKIC